MLIPALADNISACEESFYVWARRAIKTGARFDTVEWARKASFFTMGSMTFMEAYQRTGKILNVSVIPYDTHSFVSFLAARLVHSLTHLLQPYEAPVRTRPAPAIRQTADATRSQELSHRSGLRYLHRRHCLSHCTGYPQSSRSAYERKGWSSEALGVSRETQGWIATSRYSPW